MTESTVRLRADSAVFVRDLTVRYDDGFEALRGVSFHVPRGSICGLIGPNGAGKTSMLRVLAADLTPGGGYVRVLDCDLPGDAMRLRRRLGYMPDSAGLYEELTLREYLWYFAAFYGLRRERRREAADSAIELAGATRIANRRLVGLSKGERQRVLLARALVNDPEVLLLDEPADGLDPRGRVELREILTLLRERGRTVVVSSHILTDLEEICTHLLLVDRGRLVFGGTRTELLASGLERARVRIECLGPSERLVDLLATLPGVTVEVDSGRSLDLTLPGDPRAAWEVLQAIVLAGHEVSSFGRTQVSLEELYLRLTDRDEGPER